MCASWKNRKDFFVFLLTEIFSINCVIVMEINGIFFIFFLIRRFGMIGVFRKKSLCLTTKNHTLHLKNIYSGHNSCFIYENDVSFLSTKQKIAKKNVLKHKKK